MAADMVLSEDGNLRVEGSITVHNVVAVVEPASDEVRAVEHAGIGALLGDHGHDAVDEVRVALVEDQERMDVGPGLEDLAAAILVYQADGAGQARGAG